MALIAGGMVVIAAASAGIALAASSSSAGSAPAAAPAHKPLPIQLASGTYTCNQGRTGMKMTITGPSDTNLQATVDFYPVSSNPSVPNGSYAMTGAYSSSGGLVLTPDHWIDQPPGYEMVGFSSPGPSGSSMQGTVQFDGCTTFSVSE